VLRLVPMLRLLLIFVCLVCLNNSGKGQNFEQWKIERKNELLGEEGWINLVGLIWLDDQKVFLNQVTPDSLNVSAILSKKNIGTFQFSNDSVWFSFNSKIWKKNKIKTPTKILQYPSSGYSQGGVYFDRWKWSVINRGGQFALRLRDLNHPELAGFSAIPYFDYDSSLVSKAFFQPKFNETMNVPNVLGQLVEWKVLGVLKFQIDNRNYELTALDEGGKFFVIFSDLTNESETYPIGRYLYVNYPDKNGFTTLDFNFSYNPPCAFTAFATCPIPPKENRLDVAIRAGEKNPKSELKKNTPRVVNSALPN
jgi:uncharacterized protein